MEVYVIIEIEHYSGGDYENPIEVWTDEGDAVSRCRALRSIAKTYGIHHISYRYSPAELKGELCRETT